MKSTRRTPKLNPEVSTDHDVRRIHASLGVAIHPLEEAQIYARLMKKHGFTSQRQLATYLGLSQPRVSQRMALLDLAPEIAEVFLLPDSNLTERHLRSVRRLHNAELELWLAKRIVVDRLTIDQTEDIVLNMLDELGVRTPSRRGWSQAPGLRWRMENDELVLRVHGASPSHRLKALKRFVKIFRTESRSTS